MASNIHSAIDQALFQKDLSGKWHFQAPRDENVGKRSWLIVEPDF